MIMGYVLLIPHRFCSKCWLKCSSKPLVILTLVDKEDVVGTKNKSQNQIFRGTPLSIMVVVRAGVVYVSQGPLG